MTKYDRKILARNSLTELEEAIIEHEENGWELDPTVPSENSATLLAILRKMRKFPNGVSIHVSMRRPIFIATNPA